MEMSIDELITWCEEEEQGHRIKCKRADDASGYTRSKDKNIRTAVAIREEVYGDFYKQTADTMRKYQKFQDQSLSLYMERLKADMVAMLEEIQLEIEEKYNEIPIDYSHPERIRAYTDILCLVQQKINSLKEDTDGTNYT